MKKLIFLLILAIALVGFLPAAEADYPPWVNTLEAATFGIGVDDYIVTPDTALVFISDNASEQASLQIAKAQHYIKAMQSQEEYITSIWDTSVPDYNLRC